MLEKITELLAENLGVAEEEITMESSFQEDLGADSLDLFELISSLEDEFEIEIPTEELENLNTVGDVVNYIESHK